MCYKTMTQHECIKEHYADMNHILHVRACISVLMSDGLWVWDEFCVGATQQFSAANMMLYPTVTWMGFKCAPNMLEAQLTELLRHNSVFLFLFLYKDAERKKETARG